MKKIILLIAGIGLFSLASCKKDRTCNCTQTQTTGNTVSTITINGTFTKISKADAKNACSNSSSTTTDGGSTTTVKTDCKLS